MFRLNIYTNNVSGKVFLENHTPVHYYAYGGKHGNKGVDKYLRWDKRDKKGMWLFPVEELEDV